VTLQIKKLSDDVFQLPDGSITFSKATTLGSIVPRVEYTINHLLLFLLYAQRDKTIRGRTVLFKELFVIEREIFSKDLFQWKNIPGKEDIKLAKFLSTILRVKTNPRFHKPRSDTIVIDYPSHALNLTLSIDRTRALLRNRDDDKSLPLYNFLTKKDKGFVTLVYRTKEVEDCGYVPYQFGPYSFVVANKLENMINVGLIERTGKRGTVTEEFGISPKGEDFIKEEFNSLSTVTQERLRELRKGLDQYGTRWIVKHVYSYYPQFVAKSKISYRYKLITWGLPARKEKK